MKRIMAASVYSRYVIVLLLGLYGAMLFPNTSMAEKIYWWVSQDKDNPNIILVVSEEDGVFYLEYWDLEGDTNWFVIQEIGNPSADGQPTGLGRDKDTVDKLKDRLKKIGAKLDREVDPLKTPIGRGLVENGKLPGADIDPWELGSSRPGDSQGGQGGIDPGVPIGDIINILKGKGGSEDDDDETSLTGAPSAPPEFGGADADPDLVNPVPIRNSLRPVRVTRSPSKVRSNRPTRVSRTPASVRGSRLRGLTRGSISVGGNRSIGMSRGSTSVRGRRPAGVSRVSPSSARRR